MSSWQNVVLERTTVAGTTTKTVLSTVASIYMSVCAGTDFVTAIVSHLYKMQS